MSSVTSPIKAQRESALLHAAWLQAQHDAEQSRLLAQQNVGRQWFSLNTLSGSAAAIVHPGRPEEPVARADMQVRDLIAWRAWRITPAGYLQSVAVADIWLPGVSTTGDVSDHNGKGVHAYMTKQDALVHAVTGTDLAWGTVLLWGDVVEHERGYRAEHAKVMSIDDVIWKGLPPWHETCREALAFLRHRYSVADGG